MSMDMIWQYCQRKAWKRDTKINLFLFLHTIIWAIAGICLWSLVSIFILRDIGWMLTFAGHAAFSQDLSEASCFFGVMIRNKNICQSRECVG